MKCKFCGAEVIIGEKCMYCGSVAEYHYYGIRTPKAIEKIERRKNRLADGRYTVKCGDTLWKISEAFYGNGIYYSRIAKANKIKNPNLIYPGQRLEIPMYEQRSR